MFLFIRVLTLNWVINNVFKVTWQVRSTIRNNIWGLQLLVLQLSHNILMFWNFCLMGYRNDKQSQNFNDSCLFFLLCLSLQSLLSQTLSPTSQGLSGVLLKQQIIRDPVRLWNLLGESQRATQMRNLEGKKGLI